MFSKLKMNNSTDNSLTSDLARAKQTIDNSTSIIVGAGVGLSIAAGFTLTGSRFSRYFSDFQAKYGIPDMYSGGFFSFPTPQEKWAWWSRVIWLNRYQPAPLDTYRQLRQLVGNHDYFVLTTNVDHQFQQAGFAKQRLFYTQGDYGLFQKADLKQTYDNYELTRQMVLSQGFTIDSNRHLLVPSSDLKMQVSPELADRAEQYQLNLRVDDQFVEDQGWHQAATRFNQYINRHQHGRVVFLELGVGMNTPSIIKYPFWQWVNNNPNAHLITVDSQHIYYAQEIASRTVGLKMDINDFLAGVK